MKILVTGIAGFLGSHLQDYLIQEGHEVHGIDNLTGGYLRNVHEQTTFHLADLSNDKYIDTIFSGHKFDVVYHLAADATEGRSQFTPLHCTKNNLYSFVNVLKASIKHEVPRFVLTSSMSVYGRQAPPFNEDLPRDPVDVYGVNKASMERILEIMAGVHGFDYTIIRPHNVFGERQNMADPYRNVAAIFINRLLAGKNIYVYGDGEQERAFTYVDNFTPYLAKAAFLDTTKGQIINIGPTEAFTINQLAQAICKEVGCEFKPTYMPDRPTEVKHAYCTADKAERLLGYKTTVGFEEGIARMVVWARELGYQEPKYLESLEIINDRTPATWKDKLI